jgi:hypothetical protein
VERAVPVPPGIKTGSVMELPSSDFIVREVLAFNRNDTSDFGNDLYLL